MAEWIDFDATLPFIRVRKDGTRETRDVTMRIPAVDRKIAEKVAARIAFALVEDQGGDDWSQRWKIGRDGPVVEVAEADQAPGGGRR